MQSITIDKKKWGNISLLISFFVLLFGIADFFIINSNYSITIILMSLAALFSSVRLRAEKDLPIFRFLIGLFIALAVFSQYFFTNNQYFAIFGLIVFVIFGIDYVKYAKKIKK